MMADVSTFRVLDGGMGTELIRIGGGKYDYIDNDRLWSSKLLLLDPEQAIKTVHRNFLEAGADIIETNTYMGNVNNISKELDMSVEEAVSLANRAVQVAVEARDEFWESRTKDSGGRRKPLVAGSCGPYGCVLWYGAEYNGNYISDVTTEFLMDWHRPNIKALVDAGVDIIALETIPAMGEAIALINLLKEFPDTKAWLAFSCKENGRTCHGEPVSDIIDTVLASDQVIAVGCNCTAPDHVEDVLKQLQPLRGKKAIVVYANSGEEWVDLKWVGSKSAKQIHEYVPEWVTLGANWIGGCCRVYSDDIKQMRQVLQSC